MKMPTRLVARAALNAGTLNSRGSIIGSARPNCRRTNTTPTASPTRMAETTSQERPSWAISLTPKITVSTATRSRAALARSSRSAPGSRYSGSTRGPRTSSRAMTGKASRNTEPHQKCSSSTPPTTGPTAPPAEKAVIHTPMATVRCLGSWNMLKISDSVDGARVAPAMPSRARLAISISGLTENAAATETTPKAAAPDPVAEGPHGDQEPGDHEAVDVGDPQQLGAARLEVFAQGRHGQVQDGQVHRIQQAGEREHGQPDPLTPPGQGGLLRYPLVGVVHGFSSSPSMPGDQCPRATGQWRPAGRGYRSLAGCATTRSLAGGAGSG